MSRETVVKAIIIVVGALLCLHCIEDKPHAPPSRSDDDSWDSRHDRHHNNHRHRDHTPYAPRFVSKNIA